MDHQAFAQLLGNYGEFVGALTVVVTLAFLTKQLRDSTRSANAAAHSQRTSRNIDLIRWRTDLDVALIREKIDLGGEVSAQERNKVRAVDHATLRHFEDLHYQTFEEGKFGLRRSFKALVDETLSDAIKTQ